VPFEEIACTNCGSPKAQELKPGTFFCHHCETLFKHIDPSRITIQPGMCEHGDPIQAQCQICRAGICRQRCDAVSWGFAGPWVRIPTVGFGYLHVERSRDEPDTIVTAGPFLCSADLLASLALTHGRLSHVCRACLIAAVPGAADHIAAGAICETPGCGGKPCTRCACCGGAFCRGTLCRFRDPRDAGHDETYPRLSIGYPDGASESRRTGGGLYHAYVAVDLSSDYCHMCMREEWRKISALSRTVAAQEYADVLVPGDNRRGLHVQFTERRTQRGWRAESERAEEVAKRCAEEIEARVIQLLVVSPCDRRQAIMAGQSRRLDDYAIFDERDHVPAAASGDVTDAR
jgi:hypothetical protein